jgi:hypothetical protein
MRPGEMDASPRPLYVNNRIAFQGSIILGNGFTFTESPKADESSLSQMEDLISSNSHNGDRILPYIGSNEVNTDPRHLHDRYAIDFFDLPLRRSPNLKNWAKMSEAEKKNCFVNGVVPHDYLDAVAEDWPDLLEIVAQLVKPSRDPQKRKALRERWWQYADKRPGLYSKIDGLEHVFVTGSKAVMFHMIARVNRKQVFSDKLIVFASDDMEVFALLQSRIHEAWSKEYGSTFGSSDALTYNPSQVFLTFPFPADIRLCDEAKAAGLAYHELRAKLMVARNEGLTKTYTRFHDRSQNALDISSLRELHAEMDAAVLRAYGWDDLADLAQPEFIEQDADEGKQAKTRLDWPSEFKDEVLARLLALNAKRAEAERAAGLIASDEDDDQADEDDEGEAA